MNIFLKNIIFFNVKEILYFKNQLRMMCLQKLIQLKTEKLQLKSPFIKKNLKDNTQTKVSLWCKYVQIKVPAQKTQKRLGPFSNARMKKVCWD